MHFNPNARRPGTTGCPRNRLWACVCYACGASCERCSVRARGKVFVSPSPGPWVCCVSVEGVRCCGSSTGRKPDPGPERRGRHPVRPMHHIREVTLGSPKLQIWQRGRLWMMSALELLSRLPLRPTGTREWRSRNTPRCHCPECQICWAGRCVCLCALL